MNEIVSFEKEIEFKTMLDKITSISLEHTLSVNDDYNIKGDLIVSGTYKETQASIMDDQFSYKIPIDIILDSKYNLTNMTIDIDDFTYDVISPNKLKVNVDLLIDKLELKELNKNNVDEIINMDDLFLEKEENIPLDVEIKDEKKEQMDENKDNCDKDNNNEEDNQKDESLFSNINSINETFKTYTIYIMRENDSLDEILTKYNVSREKISEYNDLDNVKVGTKIIIPSNYE